MKIILNFTAKTYHSQVIIMSAFLNRQKKYFIGLISSAVVIISILMCAGCGNHTKNNNQVAGGNPKDLALQYLAQNKLEEAEAAFEQAIKMSPNDITNYTDLARLYMLQKNYDAAKIQVQAGLKIKPANEDLMLLLAMIDQQQNNIAKATDELNTILKNNPKNVKAWYQLAEMDTSVSRDNIRKNYLLQVLSLVPANIVPRLQLAEIFARDNKTDSSRYYLQSVKKIAPDFSDAAQIAYQQAAALLDGGKSAEALPYIQQLHELMKITPLYISGTDELALPKMYAGYFQFDTNIHGLALNNSQPGTTGNSSDNILNQITFTDTLQGPGFSFGKTTPATSTVMAVTDYDAQGNIYIYSSYLAPGAASSTANLYINKMGDFEKCKVIGGIDHAGQDLDAAFADYDNDGYQDLFIATTKGIIVYRNQGDGTFARVTDNIGLNNSGDITKLLIGDFDQDGDLDIFAGSKNGNKFFRNNGDGTFTENAATMGLANDPGGISDMDFGDWDDDGDLDIIMLKDNGQLALLNNNRHANFTDITNAVGLQNPDYNGTAVAFGDYNNDGRLDILLAGSANGKCYLLKNDGDHFTPDDIASKQLTAALKGIKVYDVRFVDFDNDGHQDIAVAGINENNGQRGVKLFHNDGEKGFSDVSNLLPTDFTQAYHIGLADFNYDGDEDIFLSGPSGIRLFRNDGGNLNNYVQVQLTGLSYGNSKNNRLGIGAQVELKSGDLYQLKTVKGTLTEFGVGQRTRIDAVRIIWPNGVPQTVADPTRKQRVLEQEQLKGSCPFLFTWNGKKFEFRKDMMWRSALGMPLVIHGKDTTFAYSGPSKEYLLIPGNELQPKNGLYKVKITEELWEAIFFDKIKLIAVDHPDSVKVYADEKFVAPPYPGKKVYEVAHPYLPVSAVDGNGNNVLPRISQYDFKYVDNFSMGKFQGLAKEHDLILDLGKKAHGDSIYLFMRGWVFPTDASINMELTQTKKYQLQPPSLQVINKQGKWQTVIPNIGYPMGRDKMVIVNLSGKFFTKNDRRVRIRTNMQIYWDHIFFAVGHVNAPVKMDDVKMVSADLGYHGFSRDYRKGGPYGPEWLDYYHVTTGQKWRDLTGYYTRYGNVLPLLKNADDKYIIADGGDEVTINFDAKDLPALPKGWKRDFLIYSEGWVKDGDMNTAYGQTVAPLPFHGMPSYPYPKNITYPTDPAHREYQKEYNTRKVTTQQFRNAIRMGTFENAPK